MENRPNGNALIKTTTKNPPIYCKKSFCTHLHEVVFQVVFTKLQWKDFFCICRSHDKVRYAGAEEEIFLNVLRHKKKNNTVILDTKQQRNAALYQDLQAERRETRASSLIETINLCECGNSLMTTRELVTINIHHCASLCKRRKHIFPVCFCCITSLNGNVVISQLCLSMFWNFCSNL